MKNSNINTQKKLINTQINITLMILAFSFIVFLIQGGFSLEGEKLEATFQQMYGVVITPFLISMLLTRKRIVKLVATIAIIPFTILGSFYILTFIFTLFAIVIFWKIKIENISKEFVLRSLLIQFLVIGVILYLVYGF